MIGGTGLHVTLGAAPPADAPEAEVRRYIGALAASGLHVLFCVPGSKIPAELRPSATITKADREYRAEMTAAGRPGADRMKAPSGLHLATADKTVLNRYLKRYREPVEKGGFGETAAVNLAVEVGRSRLIVVDCDTRDEVRAFLQDTLGDPDAGLAPTVRSPGQRDVSGEWAHKDGGHYWFTVPSGTELPRSTGMLKRSVVLDAGTADERTVTYSILWADRYVLIPPSVRAEGAYVVAGETYSAEGTPLLPWIVDHEAQRQRARDEAERLRSERIAAGDTEFDDRIAEWAEATPWDELLEPLGWTPYSVDNSCGCAVWTAPGLHGSQKSATCHDPGCSLGRYTRENAPMHIWTDNPGEPFAAWIDAGGSKTVTKLRVAALSRYDGDMRAAVTGLGIADEDEMGERRAEARSGSLGVDLGSMSDLSADIPRDPVVDTGEPPTAAGELLPEAMRPEVDPAATQRTAELIADAGELHDEASAAKAPEVDPNDPTVLEKSDGFPLTIRPFDLWRDTPPPEWDIDGLIERGSLCSIIGEPGIGKSNVVLDMIAHMVAGRPWREKITARQRALYLPGEGLVGAVARLRSWEDAHSVDIGADLWISDAILQARTSADHWAILAEFIVRNGIGVLVFDTFARMAVGVNENDATEVGLVINRLDQVRRETNATVVVVHHTGKATGRSRGSSALTGAVDSELLIDNGEWIDAVDDGSRPTGKPLVLRPTKIKNGPDGSDAEVDLLLRSWGDSVIVTGPSGNPQPTQFDPAEIAPVIMPEHITTTAWRIYAHLTRTAGQLGATATDIARDVSPDVYTVKRRAGSARYWRGRIGEALDLAAAVGAIDNPNSSARWVAVAGLAFDDVRSRLSTESQRRNGLADDIEADMTPHEPSAAARSATTVVDTQVS